MDNTKTAGTRKSKASTRPSGQVNSDDADSKATIPKGQIKIDPEFRKLIPPASADELTALREQLKEDQICYSPLIVWEEEGILLDGHTRWEICQELGIEPNIQNMSFPSREAAENWIIDNQLRRRNLGDNAIAYYRGRMFRRRIHATKRRGKSAAEVAREIAKLYGKDERTIKREAQFSSNLDVCAATLGESFRSEMLSDKADLTREMIATLAGYPPDEMKEMLVEIRNPAKPDQPAGRAKANPETALLRAWQKASDDQKRRFFSEQLFNEEGDGELLAQLLEHLDLTTEGAGQESNSKSDLEVVEGTDSDHEEED